MSKVEITESRILGMKADEIFSFERSINFVVLLTNDGKVIAEFARPGAKRPEPPADIKTMYMKLSIAIGMSSPMNKYHGRMRAAILMKERLNILCLNLDSKIMLVMTGPEFNLAKVEDLWRRVDQLGIV
jgi:hypothetical protein